MINCSDFVPPDLRVPVKGVSQLTPHADAGELGVKLDGQTANLHKANGNTADALHIMSVCDQRNRQIINTLMPEPWYGKFDPFGTKKPKLGDPLKPPPASPLTPPAN